MRGVTMTTALVDLESAQAAIQFDRCDPYAPNPGVQTGLYAISNPRLVSTPQPKSFMRITTDRYRYTLMHTDHASETTTTPCLTTIRSRPTP